jgi:predicted RNA-binding Zn ribbon-like protein
MGADLAKFPFVGGSLALDFTNTQALEQNTLVECLNSDRDLFSWASLAGLVVLKRTIREARTDLDPRIPPVRQAIRDLMESMVEQRPPPRRSLELVNRTLATPTPGPVLLYERGNYRKDDASVDSVEAVCRAVTLDALRLLTGDDVQRIRRCANRSCVLLFVHRSRGPARKWCSMNVCGNRAKVAAYHERSTARER